MVFYCSWKKNVYHLEYELVLILDITENPKEVSCQEKLKVSHNHTTDEFTHGYDSVSSSILLRTTIYEKGIDEKLLKVIELFFRSLSLAFYYHLQPSFLKGIGVPFSYNYSHKGFMAVSHINFCQQYGEQNKIPNIAIGLGEQGHNLQELI